MTAKKKPTASSVSNRAKRAVKNSGMANKTGAAKFGAHFKNQLRSPGVSALEREFRNTAFKAIKQTKGKQAAQNFKAAARAVARKRRTY